MKTSVAQPTIRTRSIFNVIALLAVLICGLSLHSLTDSSIASVEPARRASGTPAETELTESSSTAKSRRPAAISSAAAFFAPTLGNYGSTSVVLGGNTTVTPDAIPTGAVSATANTTAYFLGELEADPITGLVRVTNAHQAGAFTVTVTAYDAVGATTTRTFTLTVTTPAPCDTFGLTSFAAAANFVVGTAPFSVSVGDFNGDGKQDLAVANQTSNTVSVLLRNVANTGFNPKVDFAVGTGPVSVAVGDFNGDGKEDIVAANNGSDTVSVLLRNATNTGFDPKVDFPVAGAVRSVAVGDFNGDGKQDIVTANLGGMGPASASVLLRNAANTGFDPKVDLLTGIGPFCAVVGDFNGDGKQDVATSNISGNSVSVFLRNAANTGFDLKVDSPAGNFPVSVAVGDFNGDGKQDLVTANRNDNTLSVLLRNATNTGFDAKVDYPGGATTASVAVGDFNSDGKQDLACVNNTGNSASVLLRNAANTGFDPKVDFAVGSSPTLIKVGDFNADGKQDIVAVNNLGNSVSVLQRQCAPVITAAGPLSIQQGSTTNLQIATVSDGDQPANTLIVTATPLTGTGVTVTNIVVDALGNVTADVAATCTATNSTFTLTVTDSTGLTATATLTVNVTPDATPPTLTCPGNIAASADAGLCTAVVTYTTPTGSDNCVTATVVCSPASGAIFPTGATTVTCTATDGSGNTASCTFTVTITDTQAPTVTCPANITQSTDAGVCTAVVTYTAPTPADNCPGSTVACVPASGTTFAKGPTTVTCTATDAATLTATCTFTVTINDTEAPVITCPANITQGNDAGLCSAVVTFTTPVATDNCTGVGTTVCTPASGSIFPAGATTVNCTVSDASTNPGTCSFTVTVNDTTAPTITCPANITQANDTGLCSAVVTFTTPTAADNCTGVGTVTCAPASGSIFARGATTVTCSVTDASANPGTCSFTVTVNDTQAPAITCPANITMATAPGVCSAVVKYVNATATDNCPGVSKPTCTPASGSTFNKGVTTVTCTVNDASKNSSSCTFTVTVNDTEPPVVMCPANITTATDPGQCAAVVNFVVTATDNCPKVVVVAVPASGSTFPKGTTTVTATATDASGNTATCMFTVTVNDTQPPAIVCPASVTAVPGPTCVTATYAPPVVTDNCPGSTFVCTPASGGCFPIGSTSVMCVATDASGNTATCGFGVATFDVCLQDDSNPAIVVLVNTSTGDYRFCCAGTVYSGRGTLSVRGNLVTLEHTGPDRRVLVKTDRGLKQGTASLASPPGSIRCTIRDTNTTNNTCVCQ